MQTNMSRARIGRWARRAWLMPVVLSLFACGGGGSADETQDAAQAAAIPENLAGQWETVLTYVPASYSGPIGGTAPGDGSIGITFYFSPDGRYQHVWDLAQAYFGGNCFRTAHWEEAGTLSGTAPEFTFNPGKATYSLLDSCAETKFLDPAPVTAASHKLALGHDNAGWPLLQVSFPTGDLVLEKCRHCP
jgi:hypothetical protein